MIFEIYFCDCRGALCVLPRCRALRGISRVAESTVRVACLSEMKAPLGEKAPPVTGKAGPFDDVDTVPAPANPTFV